MTKLIESPEIGTRWHGHSVSCWSLTGLNSALINRHSFKQLRSMGASPGRSQSARDSGVLRVGGSPMTFLTVWSGLEEKRGPGGDVRETCVCANRVWWWAMGRRESKYGAFQGPEARPAQWVEVRETEAHLLLSAELSRLCSSAWPDVSSWDQKNPIPAAPPSRRDDARIAHSLDFSSTCYTRRGNNGILNTAGCKCPVLCIHDSCFHRTWTFSTATHELTSRWAELSVHWNVNWDCCLDIHIWKMLIKQQ